MTQRMVIHRFRDNEAVEEAPHGAAANVAGTVAALPYLAAIQHSYEEAKASIADLARASAHPADEGESYPETRAIDLSTVKLPLVPAAVPRSESSPAGPESLAVGIHVDSPTAPPRRWWWRGLFDARLEDGPAKPV